MSSTSSYHPSALQPTRRSMSISQTFHLAHQARGKLSYEASRQDHDLRLLVGHANMLDSLMIHLADAEKSQGHWFDSITGQREQEAREHENEDYGSLAADYDSDSSEDSEDEEEEEEDEEEYEEYKINAPSPSMPLVQVRELYALQEYDEDSEILEDDDDEDGFYALTRTVSHRGPPSLCSDLSDSDDDEHSPPPSPQQPILHHPADPKQPQSPTTMATGFYAGEDHDMPPTHHGDGHYFDVQYFPRGGPIPSY